MQTGRLRHSWVQKLAQGRTVSTLAKLGLVPASLVPNAMLLARGQQTFPVKGQMVSM